MRFGLTKNQIISILKVAGWLAASSIVSSLISIVANDPSVFGFMTPIVNITLVSIYKLLEKEKKA